MFIAKDNDLIILVGETRKELEDNLKFYAYDTIEETDEEYVLNPSDGKYYTLEELELKKRERFDKLSMTRADMFEALILAFGKTKADIRALIENSAELSDTKRVLYLNRFDEALEFYRGYPAINLIGQVLGVNIQQLDEFFETKDYKKLLPPSNLEGEVQ